MEEDRYSTMRKIILLSMIMVPIVTFVTILGIGYYTFTKTIEERTIESMKRIVHDHRQMIESFLLERKADLEFVGDTYTLQNLTDSDHLRRVLDRLQRQSNAFTDLGVFEESGLHVAYQGPYKLTGKVYKDEDWFKAVLKEGYYISDVFLGFRKAPHFIIAIVRETNDRRWVVRATIDTFMFNDLVEKVRIGKTGEAYILNSDGVFQTEKRSGGELLERDPDSGRYSSIDTGINSFIQKDSHGVKYLYATTGMKDKQWLLVVRQEKADAFKAIRSATYLVVLIILIGGTVIVGVAFYLTDLIIRRMDKIDTEKIQLSQQLIGASRLAELGEMAAGFAHEINNPLQIIKSEHSLIQMILSELKEADQLTESESFHELKDSMDQIDLQISRCAAITQAILKFGRQGEPKSQDIDLNHFLLEAVGMMEKKASVHGISLVQDLTTEPCLVHGEPSELQQVFLNLLNNAMDAIGDRHGASGGRIVIKTRFKENETIEIKVEDNGGGINPENLEKIFSPFFTTKPVGKGTGLGLSVCYGIIDKMGGKMDVSSKTGGGTAFTILLPAIV